MKSIRIICTVSLLLLSCVAVQAQLNRRVNNAVKNAAERTVIRQAERRTEKAVNQAIDDALDGKKNSGNSNSNTNAQAGAGSQPANAGNAPAPTGVIDQPSAAGASAGQPANTGNVPAPATPPDAKAVEMTYAKSDFVSGDVIFFDDELSGEKMGEFPSQWDLEFGNAEIAMINGEKCISLIGHTIIMPLMTASTNYLPDEFTIEYDVFGDVSNVSEAICEMRFNDGSANQREVSQIRTMKGTTPGFYQTVNPSSGFLKGSSFIGRQHFKEKSAEMSFNALWFRPDDNSGSQQEKISVSPNTWQHIAVSFNKRALKYYVNGVRVLNIPNMKQPASLWIWAYNGNACIRNFRMAKGAVPLYDRMTADGKIITYGIMFNTGQSTVKPESMSEIMRFVKLMQENPDLKFSVEGHTDSTGGAAANQTLSEARSQAVVDKLLENGIARDRLTATGKGQSSPIADNATDGGRAQNRRVEFVKL